MTHTQVLSPAWPEREVIYEIIKQNPGITVSEICERLPHIERRRIVIDIHKMSGIAIRPCRPTSRGRSGHANGWRVVR